MKSVIGKRSIYAAGIALALPFGLAACGDDEETDNDETVVETDNQDDTDMDTNNGGDDLNDDSDDLDIAPEDDQNTDTDTDDGGSDDALGGGGSDDALGGGEKPSRDEVRNGIEMMLSEQLATMGLTDEQIEASGIGPAIDNYYTCVVDGLYDDASAQTLQVVADGDPNAPVFGDDYQLLTDVSNGCVETELEPAMQG